MMCGIAGCVDLVNRSAARQQAVERMTAALQCRGPDDSKIWSSNKVTFGHTRLAIMDPQLGTQPVVVQSSDLPVALIFGGEIYNFLELRQVLKGKAHIFHTNSDVEVVVCGFLEWGLPFFSRCRGMFAIAIWDGRTEELHLVRDPLGIKPLYFSANKDAIIFGSEPKSLFAHGSVMPKVGSVGLSELLGLWPYKTPSAAVYDSVSEVGPGEIVTWRQGTLKRHTYWRLREDLNTEDSFSAAVRRVSDLLEETVRLQLRADVPISFAISGGLDSTSVAALARRHLKADQLLSTYSVGYDDPEGTFAPSAFRPELDEPYIKLAIEELESDHIHLKLSEDDIHSVLDRTTIARDLPDTGDLDASLLLLFAKIGSNSFRVALVGEGADELFGGYPWFKDARTPHTTFPWRRYLCMWPNAIRQEVRDELRLEQYVSDRFADAIRSVPKFPAEAANLRGMREMSFLDITRFLPGQLERMDRASMANGVEARVPFCDHKLVQYVWQLPMEYKQPFPQEKHLLREATLGIVGEAIRLRAKASYPTLGGDRHETFLRSAVQSVLDDKDWSLADAIDADAIREGLAGTRKVSARTSVWLGRIFSLYRWAKTYRPQFGI